MEQRLRRPGHQLPGFLRGQPSDIGEPDKRLDPDRAADREDESVALLGGEAVAQGIDRLSDPVDRTPLAQGQRAVRCRSGRLEGQPQHGALLRLRVADECGEAIDHHGKTGRDVQARVGTIEERCSASLRMGSRQQRALIGEVPVGGRSRHPSRDSNSPRRSGVCPRATTSRAAAIRASRVRRFCSTRP